jgi:hypothetical protein
LKTDRAKDDVIGHNGLWLEGGGFCWKIRERDKGLRAGNMALTTLSHTSLINECDAYITNTTTAIMTTTTIKSREICIRHEKIMNSTQ